MLRNNPISLTVYLLIILLSCTAIPLGYGNIVHSYPTPPPVEKKKVKKKHRRKKHKRHANKLSKKAKKTLKFIAVGLAIFSLLALIIGAFLIGFGIAIWSLMAYIMLGAEILSFSIPFGLLWAASDMTIMTFTMLLFVGFILINLLVGLGLLVWGLIIAWPMGWIIGLIMLAFALLMMLVFLFAVMLRT